MFHNTKNTLSLLEKLNGGKSVTRNFQLSKIIHLKLKKKIQICLKELLNLTKDGCWSQEAGTSLGLSILCTLKIDCC